MARTATVFLVDDDAGSVQTIRSLLEPTGLLVCRFTCVSEFLENYSPGTPGCLILDVRVPDADGLQVLERLAASNVSLPTIIVTGGGDVRSCARAFKMGVVDFLQKPVDGSELLDCVLKSMAWGGGMPECVSPHMRSEALSQLTQREKGVFELLVTGKTLKQIAAHFGVTVQSVWKHQQHIFRKFNVQNGVELANLMKN